MSQILGALSAVFWGLLVLSLLVFVHEGGHYLLARASSMRVTEFFLGLPCRWKLSYKSKKYGTEVGVTPFLLGGYTKICGMEGEEDPRLASALACVQRHGRVEVATVASELGCEMDEAYELLATLVDWGSIRPFYNPELDEHEGQKDWPAAFQTIPRDAAWLTEYDRGHDFSTPGSTVEGQARPVETSAEDFLAQERTHTYLGKGFLPRVAALLAGPFVNILTAFLIVSLTLTIFGMDVASQDGVWHWQPDLLRAMSFTFDYGVMVASKVAELINPFKTMEVLSQSSSIVGISVMTSEAAKTGPIDLALMVAAISMSLGFMNLLPIPPLDGGKIVVEIVQLIIRRPLSIKAQNYVSYVGLAFFLFIFVVALRNDILKYVLV